MLAIANTQLQTFANIAIVVGIVVLLAGLASLAYIKWVLGKPIGFRYDFAPWRLALAAGLIIAILVGVAIFLVVEVGRSDQRPGKGTSGNSEGSGQSRRMRAEKFYRTQREHLERLKSNVRPDAYERQLEHINDSWRRKHPGEEVPSYP